MQTGSHTPAPWHIQNDNVYGGSKLVAMPTAEYMREGRYVLTPEEAVANAHLIAAAPAVTESGRLLLRALDEENEAAVAFHTEGLRAAIAQATGRAA